MRCRVIVAVENRKKYSIYTILLSKIEMNKREERWVSGLNHRFAKPAKGVIPSEGSNPSLSATDC